jgi:hypothetical protein
LDQAVADLVGRIAGDLDRVDRPIGRCDPIVAAIALEGRNRFLTLRSPSDPSISVARSARGRGRDGFRPEAMTTRAVES